MKVSLKYHGKQRGESGGQRARFSDQVGRAVAATQEHRGGFYGLRGPSCCSFSLHADRQQEATTQGKTEACQCVKGHLQPCL